MRGVVREILTKSSPHTHGIKVRHEQTTLGVAWALFQHLFMMAGFSLFF